MSIRIEGGFCGEAIGLLMNLCCRDVSEALARNERQHSGDKLGNFTRIFVSECFALYVGYNRRQGVSEAVARNERQHLDSNILVL
jgi:hypothetical protein